MSTSRRYVVKMVTAGSPAWSGALWGVGCTHLTSAERLFDRRGADLEAGCMLLLIDKEDKKLVRAMGTKDVAKTARYFGLSV